MERMSKTMAEGREDLERAFNIMNEELIKAEYKARVGYYGKYMDEIMEEVAKETKSYKQLEEENKKLKEDVDFFYKSAKQFREQVEKWEKDYREGNIVDARNG